MNKQTVLIVIGLTLPVVVLGILVSTSAQPPAAAKIPPAKVGAIAKPPGSNGLEQEREKTRQFIALIKPMNQEQWDAYRKLHPERKAATVQEALENNSRYLKHLDSLTQEQWDRGVR